MLNIKDRRPVPIHIAAGGPTNYQKIATLLGISLADMGEMVETAEQGKYFFAQFGDTISIATESDFAINVQLVTGRISLLGRGEIVIPRSSVNTIEVNYY